jgi:hypothetical protein
MRARSIAGVLALLSALTTTGPATGRGRPRRGPLGATAMREPTGRARPAPAPRVAVQLTALRVTDGVGVRAMVHAIARDAWGAVVACAGPSPARGIVRVDLVSERSRARVTELSGRPVTRDPALGRCLLGAIERLHPPPHPSGTGTASFELHLDMPAL